MSTNLVTRLVCENCGYIFEPGEIGFYSDDEEVWCGNTSFMPIKTPVIHPCMCPNCNTKFETIQTYDNIFKRIVSQSAADQAKATAKCDCTTYITIEESRMRFERYKKRKAILDPVQLPIAITVEFDGYFSFRQFLDMFGFDEQDHSSRRDAKTNLTLKEIKKMAEDKNGSMIYCIPESTASDKFLVEHSENWLKYGLEEYCGYFGMKLRDMIFNVMTISPIIGKPKYKVLFRPFYLKAQGETK